MTKSGRGRALPALAGAVLIALGLGACGGADDDTAAVEDVPRVGLMHVGTDHIPPSFGALAMQLEQEYGWNVPESAVNRCVEEKRRSCDFVGEDVELLWRNLEQGDAEGQAAQFVLDGVDVIVAFEDQSIRAAQAATTGNLAAPARTRDRIPVVFLHPSDPVVDGLVETLSRPGSNLTGVYAARDLVAKQLELYELLVPQLRRVLTLVDPADPTTERLLREYETAAAQLPRTLRLVIREASSAADLKRIFRSLRPGEVDGAFLLSPSLRLNHSALTIRLAKVARIPVQAHRKEWVEEGALYSYGIDLPLIGQAGARYVDGLLRGMSPADLPVEQIPKIELAVNLGTAARLGIKVPQELIIRADEVYRGGS